MDISYFFDREKEYEEWCRENKNGYVFNIAGGKTGNVIHRVQCRHLNVSSRIGTYTTRYPKYCSNNISNLYVKAEEISKPYSWRKCKDCLNEVD